MLPVIFFVVCFFELSMHGSNVDAKDADSFAKYLMENIAKAKNYDLPKDNRRHFGDTIPDESQARDFGEFDFIIVGAGSSGSVVFNRLAKRRNLKILLLEAGGEEDDFSDIPALMFYTQLSDKNWGYKTTSQNKSCLGMVDNQCFYPRGRVLGGSGTINALMYVRGNKNDFDRWEEAGNPKWSYWDVLPFFKKSERAKMWNIDISYHSTIGQLNTTEILHPLTEYFLGANEELGYSYVDYNGRSQIGFSTLQFNIDGGKRISGGRAFIDPVRKQRNVRVVTNALVTEVLLKDRTAYGVNFLKNGILYRATVRKEVILSAGAVNTPQLLMLSGIGPKEHLEELGIPVVKDLPVGKYFHDHPFFVLNFKTNYTLQRPPVLDIVKDYLDGKGFFPRAPTHGISFLNTQNPDSNVPDIEYIFVAPPSYSDVAVKVFNLRPDLAQKTLRDQNVDTDIKIFVLLLHPESEGEITLKTKNPLDFPEINPNYFSDEHDADVETMYRGILSALSMLDTNDFKRLNATFSMNLEICNEHETYSKEFWFCAIRYFSSTLYHSAGTTKMGNDPSTSVVDSELKVHGVKNLRVADCGIIPSTTSGHTNAVAFMIGEKMADILAQKYWSFPQFF